MSCRFEFTLRDLAFSICLLLALAPMAVSAAAAEPPAAQDPVSAEDLPDENLPVEDPPAEGEWVVVDEKKGLRYRIARIENVPGQYRWVDEKTVRFRHGVHFEVVNHDEDYLWVKEWKMDPPSAAARKREEQKEAEEAARRDKIASTYETDIETVDRLRFEGFEEGLPRSGQWRQGFDVADMNEDGHLDIVFGPARKTYRPRPNIFLGDGQGHWRRWREARYPAEPYDYGDAAAGDLNGDGHQDLVFGVHLRGLLALVGDGKGGFRTWSDGIAIDMPGQGGDATFFSSRAIELRDWNKDGRLDILALGEGPKGRQTGRRGEVLGEIINTARGLVVYVNQGDGSWVPKSPSEAGFLRVQFGDGFAVADFNGDGREDIALASRMRNNQYVLGIATEDGLWTSRALKEMRPRIFVGAVAVADHDGDGVTDLFIGYQTREDDQVWRTGIDVFSPAEDLTWRRRTLHASDGQRGIYSLATGDLDGDGNIDVVGLTGDAESWVFLGDGDGFFVREDSPELPPTEKGCHGYSLRLHDLDRDGRDELIAGFAGEQSGLPGVPGLSQPGCKNQGSLRVWKAVSASTEAASEPAAAAADAP